MSVSEKRVSDLESICIICNKGDTQQALNIAKANTLSELMPHLSEKQKHTAFRKVNFCANNYDMSTFTGQKLFENSEEEFAFQIRREILRLPQKKLIDNIKLDDILSEDADLPAHLIKFMNNLIIGPYKRWENSEKKMIRSISSDIVYAVSNARVKPAKHLAFDNYDRFVETVEWNVEKMLIGLNDQLKL